MKRVAIVGGGFSGTMVAAQLARLGASFEIVLHDRGPRIGEGIAYRREGDALLNVPAARMSAWPDRPDDFRDWARAEPAAFLPRRVYGDYLRATLAAAGRCHVRRAEVRVIERSGSGWRVDGELADAVVLATGHRLPSDPIGERWRGSRARYLADPWHSLDGISPEEPVLLLGSGLTAIDVACALFSGPRRAPVVAVSRRGLVPAVHEAAPPVDWRPESKTARGLLREVRAAARGEVRAAARGVDWRSIVDGLRPHTAALWRALPLVERARFLRHVRPFWEIHRHRMPPAIGARIAALVAGGRFRVIAGRVVAASPGSVELSGGRVVEAAWVINCTGPGRGAGTLPPLERALIDSGAIAADPLGLGIRCDASGRAAARLFVIGTLRKGELWESTAVPELRVQAAEIAAALIADF